jgi:hypothetical protein
LYIIRFQDPELSDGRQQTLSLSAINLVAEQMAPKCAFLDGVFALAADQHTVPCVIHQEIACAQRGRHIDAGEVDRKRLSGALVKGIGGQAGMMPVGQCVFRGGLSIHAWLNSTPGIPQRARPYAKTPYRGRTAYAVPT